MVRKLIVLPDTLASWLPQVSFPAIWTKSISGPAWSGGAECRVISLPEGRNYQQCFLGDFPFRVPFF